MTATPLSYANNGKTAPGIKFTVQVEGDPSQCLSIDRWFCGNVKDKATEFKKGDMKVKSWCGYGARGCRTPDSMQGNPVFLQNVADWISPDTLVRNRGGSIENCVDQHFDRSPLSMTFGPNAAPCIHKSFEQQIKINPAAESFEAAGVVTDADGNPTGAFENDLFRGNPKITKMALTFNGPKGWKAINLPNLPDPEKRFSKFTPSTYKTGAKHWYELSPTEFETLQTDLQSYVEAYQVRV